MATEETFESLHWKVAGMKAVILYPALTTPCMVDKEGILKVVLAIDEKSFAELEKQRNAKGEVKFTPHITITEFEALKFHSQFLLVPWGNGHSERFEEWRGADVCIKFYHGINLFRHTLFGSPNLCREIFNNSQGGEKGSGASYSGSYLGPMQGSTVIEAQSGSERVPLGILADAAVTMYEDAGYTHLFYLEFGGFQQFERNRGKEAMYELVWLCTPTPPEHPNFQYEHPSDTVMVENFERNINPFLPPNPQNPLLEKNVDTKPQKILKSLEGSPEDLNLFRLRSLRAEKDEGITKLTVPSGVDLKELPWLTQKGGRLLYSRHPVYFKEKITRFAAMSDLHLSSRQMLYRTVNAQVIPGADEKDSPFIGKMAHDNFSSVRDLMQNLCAGADALLIAGDIYDHRQNLDPKVCIEEGKITNTAALWGLLDYGNYKGKPEEARYYPKHIDGFMMLELILELYASDQPKPIFFVAGNHEGYRLPYGISPRLGKEWKKLNEGIPADHNLSIYEAVLLYGPAYHKFTTTSNFNYAAMEWLYQTFTPWSDFYISQKNFNLVGLGWGQGEDFLQNAIDTAGKITLPTAKTAVNDMQKALIEMAAEEADRKKNILLSHFTHVNYEPKTPFVDKTTEKNEVKKSLHREKLFMGFEEPDPGLAEMPLNKAETRKIIARGKGNSGCFHWHQQSLYFLRECNKIHYSISGHSHRAGSYTIDRLPAADIEKQKKIGNPDGFDKTTWVSALLSETKGLPLELLQKEDLPSDKSIALVSGSAGPISSQNMEGELRAMGMDAPQGLILDIEKENVEFMRWKNGNKITKPRFSMLMANFSHFKDINPFMKSAVTKEIVIEKPKSSGDHAYGQHSDNTVLTEAKKKRKTFRFDIHIQTDAKGEKRAEFHPSQFLWKIFQDWPVTTAKLLKVDPAKPHEKPKSLVIDFGDQDYSSNARLGTVGYKSISIDEILSDAVTSEDEEAPVFFVSLFFKTPGGELGNLIKTYYEIETPWSMPATVEYGPDQGELFITLDYRELPDFKFMSSKFEEFSEQEKGE